MSGILTLLLRSLLVYWIWNNTVVPLTDRAREVTYWEAILMTLLIVFILTRLTKRRPE